MKLKDMELKYNFTDTKFIKGIIEQKDLTESFDEWIDEQRGVLKTINNLLNIRNDIELDLKNVKTCESYNAIEKVLKNNENIILRHLNNLEKNNIFDEKSYEVNMLKKRFIKLARIKIKGDE